MPMHAPQCTPDPAIAIYIAVQPFLKGALVMCMGVCIQFGDVYMGRCTAGIGMQSLSPACSSSLACYCALTIA